MKVNNRYIISVVTIPVGLLLIYYSISYFLSTHTEYCPLSHRFNDMAKCVVLDRSDNAILIQHEDLDKAIAYLEITHAEVSEYYKLPDSVTVLAPSGYTAKIVPTNYSVIIFNGRQVHLENLAHHPE